MKTKKTKKAKKTKVCSSCYGYGFWTDGTAPMGPIDASDGVRTIACIECGANANPQTKAWVCKEMSDKELQKRLKSLLKGLLKK